MNACHVIEGPAYGRHPLPLDELEPPAELPVSIAHEYRSWAAQGADRARSLAECSPCLIQLEQWARSRWPFLSPLGCHSDRFTRGSTTTLSDHAFGAATDLGYTAEHRNAVVADVLPSLVAWSQEWGLQAIHDYLGSRIWRAGRTWREAEACTGWWKAQRKDAYGMGQPWGLWLHCAVHPDRWSDSRTAAARGVT